jgi:gamma-glutamylcyclotransferase (GGCT)/AIG2-like uncharacterized protein YtfP
MSNPTYACVRDYATYGGSIVEAYPAPNCGLSLTGLLVDVDPAYWPRLDDLEYGYDRKVVTTINGATAYMYVGKESNESQTD